MTISSSNIHNEGLTNPLDERYVPQYAEAADLPEVSDADDGRLAVVQDGHELYQVVAGAWALVGVLTVSGGGGGTGDMLKSAYDTDDDGTVNAADTATEADAVTGVGAAGAHMYYGTDAAGVAGFYTRGRLTTSASSAPTVNDDSGDGYVAPWFWYKANTGTLYVLVDAAVGAAVWEDVTTAASVTGLTNPLVATLDAAGELIQDAVFSGFVDHYYDLSTDPDTLISTGVATLVKGYNAWMYDNLASALEIVLPDPSTVTAGDAPFGIISVQLASGGSVTISETEPWEWEKASPADGDPTIPTTEGSAFRIRYSYDPVAAAYAVSLSHMTVPAPEVEGAVEFVASSNTFSNLSHANKDTHDHTHTLTSVSQDGTKYLIVGFFADGAAAPLSVPGFLTAINSPPSGSGTQVQNHWYYYKFDGDDISAGEVALSFGKVNEIAQIVAFEVTGAHASSPIGVLAFDRSSSTTRTAIGPTDLTTPSAGCLLVCSVGMDVSSGTKPTIAVNSANGFTELLSHPSDQDGAPALIYAVLESETAGQQSTPSYTRSTDGSAATQLEAFVILPA